MSFLLILFVGVMVGGLYVLLKYWSKSQTVGLYLIFLGGALLQIIYSMLTSYNVRQWDWRGHIEYINYVVQTFQIPPVQLGWETWQPPLYYFAVALFVRVQLGLGRSIDYLLTDIKFLSTLMTMVTLAVGIWIARMLFSGKKDVSYTYIFSGVLAVFPGLILFSSHISNDVPLLLFSFIFFAFLLRWWLYGKLSDWYLAVFVIGLGLLTKSNAIPLLGIAFISLLLWRGVDSRRKVRIFSLSLLLIFFMTGWFYVLRFGIEKETFIVGNQLSSKMAVENSVYHFTAINPARIIKFPFNHNWDDTSGRDFFWEYLYRSAFFGEFDYGKTMEPISRLLLVLGFIAMPIMLIGLGKDIIRDWRSNFPVWLTFIVLLVAVLGYRIKSPYSANQDFRFIPLVIVPVLYYALKGSLLLGKHGRSLAIVFAINFVIVSVVFTVFLVAGL